MAAKLHTIQLEQLKDIAQMPDGKAAMCLEACVWCMDKNGHQNGVDFDFHYNNKKHAHSISWPDDNVDIIKIREFYNLDDAVSFGAEAIAIFLCIIHTDYDDLKRSMRKTGIDYWLGHKNGNPNLPFHNAGRLEISGILKESETNTVSGRIKEKIKQASQSQSSALPVYVIVVAFDQPYAKMVLKNANG